MRSLILIPVRSVFELSVKYNFTSLDFLKYGVFYRNCYFIVCLLLTTFFTFSHTSSTCVLEARNYQEWVTSLSKIEILEKTVRLEPKESIIFSHFEQVIVPLEHEW